jgi:uncharacterized protein (DUF2236 family)
MELTIRQMLAERVRAVFNDRGAGEKPVVRRTDGLFGPQSVAWRVHGDVTTMMVGGLSALLLQMLHPAVLAGVWDHSNFRDDMLGRLRRTARFIAITTYGGQKEAEAAIARVREIHRHVHGTLSGGAAYSGQDPDLLTWVHATETLSFLRAWVRYGEPGMQRADQDRYFAETAVVARALGATEVPTSRAQTGRYIDRMRSGLAVDARTREVARLLLQRPRDVNAVPLAVVQRAAVDLLPDWARRMHGLRTPVLSLPLVDTGTRALARSVRWALGAGAGDRDS